MTDINLQNKPIVDGIVPVVQLMAKDYRIRKDDNRTEYENICKKDIYNNMIGHTVLLQTLLIDGDTGDCISDKPMKYKAKYLLKDDGIYTEDDIRIIAKSSILKYQNYKFYFGKVYRMKTIEKLFKPICLDYIERLKITTSKFTTATTQDTHKTQTIYDLYFDDYINKSIITDKLMSQKQLYRLSVECGYRAGIYNMTTKMAWNIINYIVKNKVNDEGKRLYYYYMNTSIINL